MAANLEITSEEHGVPGVLEGKKSPEHLEDESSEDPAKATGFPATLSSEEHTGNDWAKDLFRDDMEGNEAKDEVEGEAAGVGLLREIPPFTMVFQKPLPTVSFSVLQDTNRASETEWLVGFKKPHFSRPDAHYVRYVEPIEQQLAERIEYDMDEQGLAGATVYLTTLDLAWLNFINEERRNEGEPGVSELVFELIMDRLEKEWFDL
ncbi:nuA3 HAT complex component nto1, partial [Phlyctochytrium bullatum]